MKMPSKIRKTQKNNKLDANAAMGSMYSFCAGLYISFLPVFLVDMSTMWHTAVGFFIRWCTIDRLSSPATHTATV